MKRVGEAYLEGYAGFWGYAMGRALERLASASAPRVVVRMCILQIFFAFRSDLNTPGRMNYGGQTRQIPGFPEAFMKAGFNG